jgi:hypothetical protein
MSINFPFDGGSNTQSGTFQLNSNYSGFTTSNYVDSLLLLTSNNLRSLSSNYTSNISNILNSKFDNIQTNLTFSSPLSNINNVISIDVALLSIPSLSNYYNKIEVSNISNLLSNNINNNLTLSSNFIIETSNILISKINTNNILSSVRPYPPKSFNYSTLQSNISYLTQTSISYETFTLNSDGISYGDGLYEVYSSKNYIFNDSSITLTGGINNTINDVVNDSNYKYIIFKNDGSLQLTSNLLCDILVVGGGGGGGCFGGGGGAGSILFTTNYTIPSGTHNIIIGGGGTASSSDTSNGGNGSNTTITINGNSFIAVGGGGGGSRNSGATSYAGRAGNNGGSGGGGSHSDQATNPQTNIGGISTKNTYSGWTSYGYSGGYGKNGDYISGYGSGGGGGAGSVGNNAGTNSGGNGGAGLNMTSYLGTSVGNNGWFGGGGGGAPYSQKPGYINGYANGGSGNFGGGGNGLSGNAINNTGGGGGGSDPILTAGTGGSGVVIIRYLKTTIITKKELFNFITDEGGVQYEYNNYNSNTGLYSLTGEQQRYIIKNDYFGDFLVVKLPIPIYLNKFHIFSKPGLVERAPSLWKLYASNDNSNWIEIIDASNTNTLSALTVSNYSLGFYEKLFTILNTSYLYFGLVVNKIIGGTSNAYALNFTELKLFGKESINIITKIDSNLIFSSNYTFYSSNSLNNLINEKQNTLTSATQLLGSGSLITSIDYNKISLNKPTNFQADWTSTIINKPTYFNPDPSIYYNKTEVSNISNLNSNYTTGTSNTLRTLYDSINTNLSTNYKTTGNDPNYLLKTGGTLSGTLNGTTINALTNLQENAVNLSSKYLQLSGGTITSKLSIIPTADFIGLYLNTAITNSVISIQLQNNSTYNAYIGMGCTAYTGYYANNLFIQSPNSLILNTNANGTSATPNLIINSSGDVGIGTTNPLNKLYLSGGSSGKPLIQFTQTTGWDNLNPALSVSGYTNLGGFRINGSDAGASLYQITANTDMTFLQNATNTTSGNIKFSVFGAGGNIIFNTSSTEKMRISNNGNVGIANTNPISPLQLGTSVISTGGSDGFLVISKNNGSTI